MARHWIPGTSRESLEEEEPGFEAEPFLIRLMRESDLEAIVRLDRKISGRAREAFYQEKIGACLREPDINTSLVAEADGATVGFLMGRLFFGEFGIPATRAVLDWLAVDPAFGRQGVGRALFEQYRKNMTALGVDAIDTLVTWERFDLLAFFGAMGFGPSRTVDLVWDLARYPFSAKRSQAEVRPATEADLGSITTIDREAMLTARPQYFSNRMRTCMARPERNIFLAATMGGEVAGFLMGSLFQGEFGIDDIRGVIDSFAVREKFHHRGIASVLVAHLLERLKTLGVKQMETLCRWNDWDLLRFFEYVGFRPSFRINLEQRLPGHRG
jgi:predicted N-acetyltransferase YhbS